MILAVPISTRLNTHFIDFFSICFGDNGILVIDCFFALGDGPMDYKAFLDDDDDDDVPSKYPLPCF